MDFGIVKIHKKFSKDFRNKSLPYYYFGLPVTQWT